jgi:hypothetical protein
LADEMYDARRASRWPYLQRDGRKFRFEGPDRKSLRADLRAIWRHKYPDEAVPSDPDLNSVIDDLRHLAEDADPDPATAEDQAAELIAAGGIKTEPASWDAKDAASSYEVRGGALGWHRPVKDVGTVWTPLATFDAEITAETIRDDGAEQTLTWTLRVTTTDGRTGEIQILPDQLARPQQWAAKAAGVSALVMPGLSVADHLRVAVQSRSASVVRRTVYTHTGWRKIDGRWSYLTGSGALGADGLDESVTVDLGSLSGFALPAVRDVREVRASLRESLALLGLADDKVVVPWLAAAYRAPLPLEPDCAVWLYGKSGTFKTQMTALAQQHYGPAMHAKNLPGNWTSTANALESQAFTLNGALYVVDDYSPDATKVDAQRRAAAADRLVRGSANHSGRGRMRPDGTERPAKPPRAQVLTSAEDVPPGVESMRARTFVTKVTRGDVDTKALTAAQATAAAGTYAAAMAGYVGSLARRYDADNRFPAVLAARRDDWRDKARGDGHPRCAENIASLALGWHEFLALAEDVGAITRDEHAAYWSRVWKALCAVGAEQESYRHDTDPVNIYLTSLRALIASGRAHVAGQNGGCPATSPTRWGWEESMSAGEPLWRSRGELVGWTDGTDVYFESTVAYKLARQHAEAEGQLLTISKRMLHEQLSERKLLASTAGQGHHTARRRLSGAQQTVVHLTVPTFDDWGTP